MEKLKRINNNHVVIIKDNKDMYFYSYESLICIVNNDTDKIQFTKDWNYSKTTLKYLFQFINDYVSVSVRLKNGCVYSLFYALKETNNKKDLINYLIDTKQIKMI